MTPIYYFAPIAVITLSYEMPFLQGNYDKDYEVMKEMYKSDKIWAKIVSSQNYFGSEGGTTLSTRLN